MCAVSPGLRDGGVEVSTLSHCDLGIPSAYANRVCHYMRTNWYVMNDYRPVRITSSFTIDHMTVDNTTTLFVDPAATGIEIHITCLLVQGEFACPQAFHILYGLRVQVL